jgi:hypothetical protein
MNAETVGFAVMFVGLWAVLVFIGLTTQQLVKAQNLLKQPLYVETSLRIKNRGRYDGIWTAKVAVDRRTGKRSAPKDPEDRVLRRISLHQWASLDVRRNMLRCGFDFIDSPDLPQEPKGLIIQNAKSLSVRPAFSIY